MLSISNSIELLLLAEISFVIVPLVTAWITALVGRRVASYAIDFLGERSQLWLGGLGVVIHEAAHAFLALLFGQLLARVKLLDLHYQNSGDLGSVETSFDSHNMWQKLGNFFIGLAPYYVGSLVLAVLQAWLLHNPLVFDEISSWSEVWFEAKNLLSNDWLAVLDTRWWVTLLYLVLLLMISSTVYNLSGADFRTSLRGATTWALIVLVFAVILLVFQQEILLFNWTIKFALTSFLFMLRALFYLGLSWFTLILVKGFIRPGSGKHFKKS